MICSSFVALVLKQELLEFTMLAQSENVGDDELFGDDQQSTCLWSEPPSSSAGTSPRSTGAVQRQEEFLGILNALEFAQIPMYYCATLRTSLLMPTTHANVSAGSCGVRPPSSALAQLAL